MSAAIGGTGRPDMRAVHPFGPSLGIALRPPACFSRAVENLLDIKPSGRYCFAIAAGLTAGCDWQNEDRKIAERTPSSD